MRSIRAQAGEFSGGRGPSRPPPRSAPRPGGGGRPPSGRQQTPSSGTAGAKQPVSLREVAVEQLRRIEEDGAYSGLVSGSKVEEIDLDLDRVFTGVYDEDDQNVASSAGKSGQSFGGMLALSNPSDRRLVTEIVNGCTRWRKKLDYIIARLTKRDVREIDPPLRLLLRVGLYELMALGTPEHVVNEHVSVAKVLCPSKPYAAGFVNGTLRSAIREGITQVPEAARTSASNESKDSEEEEDNAPSALELLKAKGATEAEALSTTYSHPVWMVERWLKEYGPADTQKLLSHNNRRPSFTLRRNGSVTTRTSMAELVKRLQDEGVKLRPSKFLPKHFLTVESGLQSALPYVRSGFAAVQDESAGLVVAMLDPQEGDVICDTCAAPGGKALFTADLVGPKGSVFALDINKRRVEAIDNFARTLGLRNVVAAQADLLELGKPGRLVKLTGGALSGFDKVLLDVPCSGLGVLSKRADLRWRRTKAQLEDLTALQGRMLQGAASLVNPGGLLVYSTCSPDREETFDQIAKFLERNPNWDVDAPPEMVPDECVTDEGYLLTLPHVHGIDGAFAARLRRMR